MKFVNQSGLLNENFYEIYKKNFITYTALFDQKKTGREAELTDLWDIAAEKNKTIRGWVAQMGLISSIVVGILGAYGMTLNQREYASNGLQALIVAIHVNLLIITSGIEIYILREAQESPSTLLSDAKAGLIAISIGFYVAIQTRYSLSSPLHLLGKIKGELRVLNTRCMKLRIKMWTLSKKIFSSLRRLITS